MYVYIYICVNLTAFIHTYCLIDEFKHSITIIYKNHTHYAPTPLYSDLLGSRRESSMKNFVCFSDLSELIIMFFCSCCCCRRKSKRMAITAIGTWRCSVVSLVADNLDVWENRIVIIEIAITECVIGTHIYALNIEQLTSQESQVNEPCAMSQPIEWDIFSVYVICSQM